MLLSLLIYGYSQGIFFSRKLEQASMELIPMRYICGNLNPDADTIETFRRRFIEEIKPLFKQVPHYRPARTSSSQNRHFT